MKRKPRRASLPDESDILSPLQEEKLSADKTAYTVAPAAGTQKAERQGGRPQLSGRQRPDALKGASAKSDMQRPDLLKGAPPKPDMQRPEASMGDRIARGVFGRLFVVFLIVGVFCGGLYYGLKRYSESRMEPETTAAPVPKETLRSASEGTLSPCRDTLSSLVDHYFSARLEADTAAIHEIFGRTEQEEDEDLKAKLEAQALWIQGFRNVHCYELPGLQDNECLVLVSYEVDFRRTDANAPGVMYFYAEKDQDGSWHFVEHHLKDIYDYIQQAMERPDVVSLIDDADRRLKEALNSNSTLALIYDSFINGAIYEEVNYDINREQEVRLFTDPRDSILIE